jgi:hypothetical protein
MNDFTSEKYASDVHVLKHLINKTMEMSDGRKSGQDVGVRII